MFLSVAGKGKEQSSQWLVRAREYDLLPFQNENTDHRSLICILKFYLCFCFVLHRVTALSSPLFRKQNSFQNIVHLILISS